VIIAALGKNTPLLRKKLDVLRYYNKLGAGKRLTTEEVDLLSIRDSQQWYFLSLTLTEIEVHFKKKNARSLYRSVTGATAPANMTTQKIIKAILSTLLRFLGSI
jgi:hypothetical protein